MSRLSIVLASNPAPDYLWSTYVLFYPTPLGYYAILHVINSIPPNDAGWPLSDIVRRVELLLGVAQDRVEVVVSVEAVVVDR